VSLTSLREILLPSQAFMARAAGGTTEVDAGALPAAQGPWFAQRNYGPDPCNYKLEIFKSWKH